MPFPTCLLALGCSCWELQILWMIWELVLGRYSQGKVGSEVAWFEGLSQSSWAIGKKNPSVWRFEALSRTRQWLSKKRQPQNHHHLCHSGMMFRQGRSYCGGTRRKTKRNGSQKEKIHCSDTQRPRLKDIHRNEWIGQNTEGWKTGLWAEGRCQHSPLGEEQMGSSRTQAAGGGGMSWVRNCKWQL